MNIHDQLEKILVPTPIYLEAVGLMFSKTYEKQSEIGGKSKGFVFTNKQSDVRLSISVSEAGSISTFISKNNNVFELHEYLKFKKREKEYVENFFSAPLEKYIENLFKLIDTELGSIITGKRWEDIPRDWMGYK